MVEGLSSVIKRVTDKTKILIPTVATPFVAKGIDTFNEWQVSQSSIPQAEQALMVFMADIGMAVVLAAFLGIFLLRSKHEDVSSVRRISVVEESQPQEVTHRRLQAI